MSSALRDRLLGMIRDSRASKVGLAAHRLGSDEEILIGADLAFHPASTFKLCVMMEVFRQARAGRIGLGDHIPIRNRFVSIADGGEYALNAADDSERALYGRVGQSAAIGELVRLMITESSNLATNVLLERAQPHEVSALMHELGTDDLVVRRGVEDQRAYRRGMNNSATARGYLIILRKLAERQIISPEDSDAMIEILAGQHFNQMIPAQLPTGTRVAHKTGWTADYYHDVGIIYPPAGRPIVLAILTKGYPENDEEAAHEFVASLAKSVYDEWAR